MPLDLSKLSDAVTKVAGIASENAALKQDMTDAQTAVDTLTASLIAATTSPAGAVGIAAVAAALDPSQVNAAIEAAKANQ
jgi:hypothetical protein